MRNTGLRASIVTLCLQIAACTTTNDLHGYKTRRYFGWLNVTEHHATANSQPRIERVTALGLRFERGMGIGYFDDSVLTLPKDCHLIIVAKDIQQLEAFFNAYPQLRKQEMKPCIKPIDI